MPETIPEYKGSLEYWCADKEIGDRKWDIRYMKEHFPGIHFKKMKDLGLWCLAPHPFIPLK